MELLKSSIRVKDLEIKNRLVMPPMATAKADKDGKVTKDILDYYDEKSKGGYIGLIISEHSYVSKEGKAGDGQISISKDEDIEGLRKLVKCVHDNGSKIIAQINHAGSATTKEITGLDQYTSSSIFNPKRKFSDDLPKEMNSSDIDKVVKDFSDAARRAESAGFDGVEIHSAHGYLLNQFYSPLANKRTDEYSGKILNGRIRLHLRIIESVRKAVGEKFIVALRLGACDYIDGGSTAEDSVKAVKEFEKAGIDLIDISGGFCGYINPNSNEQGYFSEISAAIKKAASIPVILTGGIKDVRIAETMLKENKADMIGVGRAILADGKWAERAMKECK